MGIPGLTDFIEKNFSHWYIEVIEGKLIVDGSYLVYELYKKLDWANGGQYPEFREKIIHFFGCLDVANINPIVVLDGTCYKPEKASITLSRRKKRVKQIHMSLYHDEAFEYYGDVLPALSFVVFQKTLIEFGISFIVVDGEADIICTVSQLANHYSCPVLATDSDYYMFNLKGGYIPLKNLVLPAESDGCSVIAAKVFYVKAFAQQFQFQDASLRLVIPAILGNDFLTPFIGMNIYASNPLASVLQEHRLSPTIAYAASFRSLEELLKHIPSLNLEHDSERAILESCDKARKFYNSEVTQSLDQLREMTEIRRHSGQIIPEWVAKKFHDGHLSKFVMDSLIQEKCILHVAADDTRSKSSHVLSERLRQYIYGLLGADSVVEYIRQDTELPSVRVTAIPVLDGRRLPSLEEVSKLSEVERKEVMYSILGCKSKIVNDLPEKWQLVIASVIYWATQAHPSSNLQKALLSCFIICSSSEKLAGPPQKMTQRGNWIHAVHVYSQWQFCFHVADSLNTLLMEPLKSISPALFYDGQIAINEYFRGRESTESSHIDKLLYLRFCGAVSAHMCADDQVLESPSKHKKKVKPKQLCAPKVRYTSPLTLQNRFAGLDLDSCN